MRSLVIVLVILVIFPFNACSQAEEAPLPPDVRTLNVCEAAIESVEARVRISGIFDGFGYSNKSLKLTLKSDGLCNDQGAGLAFVTLRDESEREKLFSNLAR